MFDDCFKSVVLVAVISQEISHLRIILLCSFSVFLHGLSKTYLHYKKSTLS